LNSLSYYIFFVLSHPHLPVHIHPHVDASALLEEASVAPENAKRFTAAFEPQKEKLRWMLKSTGEAKFFFF
jgi:hypothetical protein